MFLVLASAANLVRLTVLDEAGEFVESREFPPDGLAAEVAALEPQRPRWVWDDTSRWYPPLLEASAEPAVSSEPRRIA